MIHDRNLYLMKLKEYKPKEDEHIEGDLILCNECNTPRVFKDWLADDMGLWFIACECKDKQNRKKELEDKAYERQQKILKAKETTLMGNRYKGASFSDVIANDDQFNNAMTICKAYCDNSFEMLVNGYGLYIYGNVGSGKTYLGACTANRLIEMGHKIVFTNFTEIAEKIINHQTSDIINADFLFLDDFGTEKVSSDKGENWLQEKVFEVINRRYNLMRPVVFTSNYSLNKLITERGYAEKTTDRINEICQMVKVDGENYRKGLKL